jgi:hypothetical protein
MKRFASLVLVAGLLLASGCGDSVSPALRVGEQTFDYDTVLSEIGEWAGNPMLQGQFTSVEGPSPGSYSTEVTSAVLRYRIQRELVNAEARRRGLSPDQEQRAQARELLYGDAQTAEQMEQGFSDDYARSLLDDAALELALIDDIGDEEYGQWIARAPVGQRIEVSSRFGRWDPDTQSVVPPSGPTTTVTAITAPPVPGAGAETP